MHEHLSLEVWTTADGKGPGSRAVGLGMYLTHPAPLLRQGRPILYRDHRKKKKKNIPRV